MATENDRERLDVNKKVVALFVFGIVCALLLILIVNISINTASGVRAYVGGVGMWTKAQKESVIHLTNYIFTENEEEFSQFKRALSVNLGDRMGREELLKDDFDYQTVYKGFLLGEIHPDDIPNQVNVFRRFQWTPQVQEAIEVWTEGDEKIAKLIQFADSIRAQIQSADVVGLQQKKEWVSQLEELDYKLTELEVRFSSVMGDMARLVNSVLRWSVILLGLLLIGIGIWLVYRFLNSTKIWMQTLRESEEKFKNVLSNSRDVLYRMDLKTQKYEYVSPALAPMLGYKEKEFLEGGVPFILSKMHPEDKKEMQKVVERYDKLHDGGFLPIIEFRLKDTHGEWKWVSNVRTLVRDENGNPEAIVGTVRDISTQKEQGQQIRESLKEKEVLLQEIHHRVKNNLAIISSLLELQKDGVSKEVQEMLSSSQSRIKSIAKVHEKLYESTTLSDIQLDNYIQELIEEIKKAYASKKKDIEVQINIVSIKVDINDAIPIGLILNELINNAFKHAFEGLEEGIIQVSLKKKENKLELIVANNGNIMADDFDPSNSESLGMTLIQVFTEKMNGTLEIESKDWTSFIITFELG